MNLFYTCNYQTDYKPIYFAGRWKRAAKQRAKKTKPLGVEKINNCNIKLTSLLMKACAILAADLSTDKESMWKQDTPQWTRPKSVQQTEIFWTKATES